MSYFTVAFLDHDIILEDSLDGTDECQSREPWAYSWDGNLGWAYEYRGFLLNRFISLRGF